MKDNRIIRGISSGGAAAAAATKTVAKTVWRSSGKSVVRRKPIVVRAGRGGGGGGKDSSAAAPMTTGPLPCFQSLKHPDRRDAWPELEVWNQGYFRHCAAALAICFLKFGVVIGRHWLFPEQNQDLLSKRCIVDCAMIAHLYRRTIQEIHFGEFPILFHSLTHYSIDILINLAMAWLKFDLQEERGRGFSSPALDIQLHLFALRVLPWFIRVFFLWRMGGDDPGEKLFASLECTWLRNSCVHPYDIFSTMKVPSYVAHKSVVSIPLLGVRQKEWLHEEEERAVAGGVGGDGDGDGVPEWPMYHAFAKQEEEKRRRKEQQPTPTPTPRMTRRGVIGATTTSSTALDILAKMSACQEIVLQLPTLRKPLLEAAAEAQSTSPSSFSSSSRAFQWVQHHWSDACCQEIILEYPQLGFHNVAHKQALCCVHTEIQWLSVLSPCIPKTPWVFYSSWCNTQGTGIRAIYCFCHRHSMPLLKRVTFFRTISGTVHSQFLVDACGADLLFLDDCGAPNNQHHRNLAIRFFDSCNQVQPGSKLDMFTIMPCYHTCAVLRGGDETTCFQLIQEEEEEEKENNKKLVRYRSLGPLRRAVTPPL